MTTTLTDLPTEQGMRLRGLAMTRIETFADAAFAFAVTLLVISVDDVPRSFEEMVTRAEEHSSISVCIGTDLSILVRTSELESYLWAGRQGSGYIDPTASP